MPFTGETSLSEVRPSAAKPVLTRRGELVICEIP
jgi:hypothetical protein